ncbi:MAG: carboxypeptidase-like regulatory domain-containing protein, partial [Saprospiraceae bacterium]|nr:carboxypeptidase-like regulatory domain-containing protein [Saprospiraceae bacterium]
MKNSLLILLLSLIGHWAIAQGTITGVIKDADGGEPLIGAAVSLQGTTKGTISDWDGTFALKGVASGSYTVTV